MAIWEFDMYEIEELYNIQHCISELKIYGICHDEDMERELQAEIDRKQEEERD